MAGTALQTMQQLSGPGGRQVVALMLAAATAVALAVGAWMWSQTPDYRVLFSNLSDRDGGAIIASLQQMNVPYKFAEGGGAILVPATQVHEVRLRLAGQGLPKGGLVGFELMENQKLGTSQFIEQVNYQRALEGELARSIQSLSAVGGARVHLAIPKPSVFVREQQKPSASVLLNLHPGRTLEPGQVSAIVHLVSSSVPDLPIKNVTVLDQNGNLLSAQNDAPARPGSTRASSSTCRRSSRATPSASKRSCARSSARATCAPRSPPTSTSRRPSSAEEVYQPNQSAGDSGDAQPADQRIEQPAPARAGRRRAGRAVATSRRRPPPRRSRQAGRPQPATTRHEAATAHDAMPRRPPRPPALRTEFRRSTTKSTNHRAHVRTARGASSACRSRWWSTTQGGRRRTARSAKAR